MQVTRSICCNKQLQLGRQLLKCYATEAATASCPHLMGLDAQLSNESNKFMNAKPYSQVPGPKPLPIVGNSWRFFPIIGQYSITEVAKISYMLNEHYGDIVRLSNIIGRPDMLFIYNADEIEKVIKMRTISA